MLCSDVLKIVMVSFVDCHCFGRRVLTQSLSPSRSKLLMLLDKIILVIIYRYFFHSHISFDINICESLALMSKGILKTEVYDRGD